MSFDNFFSQQNINVNSCSCAIRKTAIQKDIPFIQKSNLKENETPDLLFLLEYLVDNERLQIFYKMIDRICTEKNVKYVIGTALRCIPKDNELVNNTASIFVACKKAGGVKKEIDRLKPNVILVVNRALYSITEKKLFQVDDLVEKSDDENGDGNRGGNFYALHEDDTWIYSKEHSCKIFPLPPLQNFIGFDNYESNFVKEQILRAKKASKEISKRKINLKIIKIEDNVKFLNDIIEDKDIKEIAMDIETSGLSFFEDPIHNISMSFDGITGYFVYFKQEEVNLWIKLFDRKDIKFIFHNGKFDCKHLRTIGNIPNARTDYDTMLATHFINENSPNSLKSNVWLYCSEGGYEIELKNYMENNKLKDFTKVPENILIKYATYDSILTYQLYEYFEKRVQEEPKELQDNFYNNILKASDVMTKVELNGIPMDMDYMFTLNNSLIEKAKEIEKEIYKLFGNINLKSPKQLSEAFKKLPNFEPLKDKDGKPLISKNGDLLLNKKILEQYANKGLSFAKKLIEYGHVKKEISQFGLKNETKKEDEPDLFDFNEKEELDIEEDNFDDEPKLTKKGLSGSIYKGKLYGGFKLIGTKSGRMSGKSGIYSSVNFQNFPKTESFRKIFKPKPGYVFVDIDYSAMEMVISSQLSGKGNIESLLKDKKDLHCYTGSKVFDLVSDEFLSKYFKENQIKEIRESEDKYELFYRKVKIEKIEEFDKFRALAKTNNFQIIYLASCYGLARTLHITTEEAQIFIDAFFAAFPEIKKCNENTLKMLKAKGYSTTLLGRKRRAPKLLYSSIKILNSNLKNIKKYESMLKGVIKDLINSATNARIQGTSGQTTNIAMINIDDFIVTNNLKTEMIMNIHDAIIFLMPINEIDFALPKIKEIMTTPYYKNYGGSEARHEVEEKIGDVFGFGVSYKKWKEKQNG